MASKKRRVAKGPAAATTTAVASSRSATWGVYAGIAVVVLLVVFWVYGPALRGPFLFDDVYALPKGNAPAAAVIHGVRPLLMLTYWANLQLSGTDTYSYHVANVFLHCVAGGLVFFIVLRLAEWSGLENPRRRWLAAFAAAVFLLHPVQTEAVAYLAGRSDGLSVMLFLAAYAVFVCRRKTEVSWATSVLVLLFFGGALLSKEHAMVLPALLLLTDYWWNPGFSFSGIVRNWKLYGPLALGAVAGMIKLAPLLLNGNNAGFGLKDFTWYQYFFTECRALFVYLYLFVLPVNQSADWNFSISKTLLDHGAIVGLVALLALTVTAWHYRRRYPLASFGFLTFLLLMAPTSSILPIKDAVTERRLYLSMLGLLLIAVEFLGRWTLAPKKLATVCAAVAVIYGGVAHARAQVWSSEVALWQDTVAKAPDSYRAHFQLGSAYLNEGNCGPAAAEYERAAQIQKAGFDLLLDWGLAYECAHLPDNALEKLRQSAALNSTAHVYTQIAKVYADQRRWDEALDALRTAEKRDARFATIYLYRGKIHLIHNELQPAADDFRHVLALDPSYAEAQRELARTQSLLRAKH